MDIVTEISNIINFKDIATGGGILAIFLRLVANKRVRQILLESMLNFMRFLFGKIRYRHPLFLNLKTTLFLVENVQLKTKLKTDIFRVILQEKINTVVSYAEIWVNKRSNHLNKLDRIDLLKSMRNLIEYMICGKPGTEYLGYEELIKRRLVDIYGFERGMQYYDYIYVKHFKIYHDKNIAFINTFFKNIFFYEKLSNEHLINEFFNRIMMALNLAIDDLNFTFDELNGSLEKI